MENKQPVEEYLATLKDEQTGKDSQALIDMMQRISGHEPKFYNAGHHRIWHLPLQARQRTRRRRGHYLFLSSKIRSPST
jgi:hypothetical protein